MSERDVLAPAREALARHDWRAGHELLRGLTTKHAEVEAERLCLLAESTWWLGQVEESIQARQEAHRIYESVGDQRNAGMCAVWLYQDHGLRGRSAAASGWLQRARRALADDPDSEQYGALLLREAEVAHGAWQLERAAELAEQARVLGRRLGSADIEAEALQALGRILIDAGQPSSGVAQLDEAMLFAVEGRLSPYSTGKVYCSLISACEQLGDLRRAAEWTKTTGDWAAQHPFAIFPGICRVHRAVVLERQGALEDAEKEAARACDELLGSHLPNAVAAYAEVGDIRRRLGDLDRSEEAFVRAEQMCGQTCAGFALLRLAQGRVEDAQRVITGCLAAEPSNRLGRARLLPAAVQIALAGGDLGAASAAVDEMESIAQAFDTQMLHAQAAVALGRLQLSQGTPTIAASTLHVAIRQWQELQVPYEIATASTLLGQAQRDAGDEEGARQSFSRAHALFEHIGARLDARSVEAAPPGRLPAGLTEREVEVLGLLAAGQANKQIAAELHLSPKTVSRHLTNIFNKLGVSSRVAATAFAFENDLVGRRR